MRNLLSGRGPTFLATALLGALLPLPAAAQPAPAAQPPAGQAPPTAPAPAEAAPAGEAPDAQTEQAREAFVLGTALAAQGQWPDALSAFERSSTVHPHPVTTYNVAYCERALGHSTRAYKLFRLSLSQHEAAATGTLPPDLLALAKSYVAEMERRVARAHVRLDPKAAPLSVDGAPLERLSGEGEPLVLVAGTRGERGSDTPPAEFELWIDPGRHTFVVSVPGAPEKAITEQFAAGAPRDLVIQTATEAAAAPAAASLTTKDADLGSPDRTWAWVAYGVGGAGIITGSVFGGLAIAKKNFLDGDDSSGNPRCESPGKCDPRYQGDIDTMNRDATIATIGFGVGIVGAGLGTYFLLTAKPSEKPEAAPSARVVPWIGPGSVGAVGRF